MDEQVKDDINKIKGSVAQIVEAISGNPLDRNDNGIVGRQLETQTLIKDHMEECESFKKTEFYPFREKINRYLWLGSSIFAAVLFVFQAAGLIIEYFIMKKP